VFCHAFAQAGVDVVVAEINTQTGPVTAEEIDAIGRQGLFVHTDVRDPESVTDMVQKTISVFGRIDFLMNNAGVVQHIDTAKVSLEEWQNVIDVNLNGLFLCLKTVGQHMIECRRGCIINMASMSGLIVNFPQNQASYNASKAAIIHLTKTLAAEWASNNIRVNAIAPGNMGTAMAKPFFDDPEFGDVWIKSIPMGRPGEPEELGPVAVFLASQASSYMTGATVVVDGGYTIW
jgi:NAD(P)-dependent dehydrogenase (short-subunit alcohol dehydrogenase family)